MRKLLKIIAEDVKLQIVVCTGFAAMVIMLYVCLSNCINTDKALNRKTIEDSSVVCEIETLTIKERGMEIQGWILRTGAVVCDVKVILRATDGTNGHVLKTRSVQNKTVSSFFSEEWDFGDIEFSANISEDKLQQDVCYQIIIALSYDSGTGIDTEYISSQKYIMNNNLYTYNPNKFIPLAFTDELMNEVVTNGELCCFDAEVSAYVYRYADTFYWIAGVDFPFNNAGKTYISYYTVTSMPEKLPQNRPNYDFVNYDFYFEDCEYNLLEETKYRVAINKMPDEFPVISYNTAVYDLIEEKVIWSTRLYPSYNLSE